MGEYLPTCRKEMERLGWPELDVLLITGDAYVDHPSFGIALIGRWLAHHGFRVGIVAQPRWTTTEDLGRMGVPRLCVGITGGSLDSMLAHYTAFRKKRSDDAYTPGGQAGARPNRATLVYANLARQAFPGIPVIIGGIEASMRRATHYDFWSDGLRRSMLLDSKADLLVYGMGERPMLEACDRLRSAKDSAGDRPRTLRAGLLRGIPGTAYVLSGREAPDAPVLATSQKLPSHEEILADPARLLEATLMLEQQVHRGKVATVQASGDRTVVFEPPPPPSTETLDELYALPFTREAHPGYGEPIPAVDMIRFSVTTHRGCAGGCSFCSLALHHGRTIAARSAGSIVSEVKRLTHHPAWKGSITDVGGPSANMWRSVCEAAGTNCTRTSCLVPEICPHFKPAQAELAALLDSISELEEVKHLRVASGVRHDLAALEPAYLRQLITRFVGGQIKLAPEHCCDHVLSLMRKPAFHLFEKFLEDFERLTTKAGKEQYVIPYLISAFPGTTESDMHELRNWLDRRHWKPQQVQCFIPLPGTVAAAMYFTGKGLHGEPIHVARTDAERLRQHYILMGTEHSRSASDGPKRPRVTAPPRRRRK